MPSCSQCEKEHHGNLTCAVKECENHFCLECSVKKESSHHKESSYLLCPEHKDCAKECMGCIFPFEEKDKSCGKSCEYSFCDDCMKQRECDNCNYENGEDEWICPKHHDENTECEMESCIFAACVFCMDNLHQRDNWYITNCYNCDKNMCDSCEKYGSYCDTCEHIICETCKEDHSHEEFSVSEKLPM